MDSRQCQVCGEVLLNVDVVLTHINMTHTKKDIYDCLVGLKSSLEIFMKQYFSLKQYVNSNFIEKNHNSIINGNHSNNLEELNSTNILDHSRVSQVGTFVEGRNRNTCYKSRTGNNNLISKRTLSKGDNQDKIREDFVDLTDIEIKSERVETDPDLDGVQLYNNLSKEDNSVKLQNNLNREDNSNEFPDHYDSVSEITENTNSTKVFPVSIIDLSQTIQDHLMNTKSEQTNVQYSEVGADNPTMFINQSSGQVASRYQINSNKMSHLSQNAKFVSDTTCSECGRVFATKFVLRRHMMSHTGERTHICPICGKGFIGKQNMIVHVRVHTGEKPYKCPYCGQQFSQYGTLYRHKKRHQAAGDVR